LGISLPLGFCGCRAKEGSWALGAESGAGTSAARGHLCDRQPVACGEQRHSGSSTREQGLCPGAGPNGVSSAAVSCAERREAGWVLR
jgi:hypothetical protein